MDIIEHRSFKLSVLDENDSKPELIGDTTISLEEAFTSSPSRGYDAWHELKFKGKYAGEVYLEMTFYPARPALPPKKKGSRPGSPVKRSSQRVSQKASVHSLPVIPGEPRPLPPHPGQVTEPLNLSSLNSTLPSALNPTIPSSVPPAISTPVQPPSLPPRTSPSPGFPPPLPGNRLPSPLAPETRSSGNTPPKARRKPVNSGVSPQYSGVLDEPFPFSPDSYEIKRPSNGGSSYPPPPRKSSSPQQQPTAATRADQDILDFKTYAPEPVFRKKELPIPPSKDFDPGVGNYMREGQWDISRHINDGYGDSVFNKVVNILPKIPPKIPLGMTDDEYDAMQLKEDPDPFLL